jgi:hypothetical protein
MNMNVCTLDDGDLDKTVADLFEENGTGSDHNCHVFSESYMIYQGLEQQELLAFGKRITEQTESVHDITIVRTPANQSWTLRKLFEETARESVLVQKLDHLMDLLKRANQVDLSKLDESGTKSYKAAVMKGFMILQERHEDPAEIDEAIRLLSEVLEKYQKEGDFS